MTDLPCGDLSGTSTSRGGGFFVCACNCMRRSEKLDEFVERNLRDAMQVRAERVSPIHPGTLRKDSRLVVYLCASKCMQAYRGLVRGKDARRKFRAAAHAASSRNVNDR